MDRVDQPIINSPSSESKIRTPAYANFDSNTDKLLHLLQFILTGVSGFKGEFETKFAPEVMRIAKEIAQIGRPHDKEVSDQDVTKGPERDDLIQKLSDALVKPFQQFTDGFLTVREWIPVLMVTTVEAYLKDVLIYAAKVDHAIMESSEQSASYAEVKRAQSLEELTEELQSRGLEISLTMVVRTAG